MTLHLCTTCMNTYSTKYSLKRHYKTKKHIKNVKELKRLTDEMNERNKKNKIVKEIKHLCDDCNCETENWYHGKYVCQKCIKQRKKEAEEWVEKMSKGLKKINKKGITYKDYMLSKN